MSPLGWFERVKPESSKQASIKGYLVTFETQEEDEERPPSPGPKPS